MMTTSKYWLMVSSTVDAQNRTETEAQARIRKLDCAPRMSRGKARHIAEICIASATPIAADASRKN
jgi:hypothetical protein